MEATKENICALQKRIRELEGQLENVLDDNSEGSWKARALDAERSLAEISELCGSGGEDTPFGRVELMLCKLTTERNEYKDRFNNIKIGLIIY